MGSRAAGEDRAVPAAVSGAAEGGGIDLPLELQREIRDFARGLPEMNHYELLGVPHDVAPEAVRGAFFERSKRFHPDRYFRKKLGPFGPLLHEIYKRVALAHEVLRDPELRARYDEGLARQAAQRAAAAAEAAAQAERARLDARSLRDRAGVKPRNFALRALERQLELGAARAQRSFLRAEDLVGRGQWVAAAAALRDAIALDPAEARYQDALAEVLPRANHVRAAELLDRAKALAEQGPGPEALGLLEEAAELRPTDARLAGRVSALLLELGGDPARALGYAERAAQLAPNDSWTQRALARAHRAAGRPDAARRALERALVLDPRDEEARAELAAL
jgi:curved DNA-binding protein CbpA